MCPCVRQSRIECSHLRKFHLNFRFIGSGVSCENIQYQLTSINDFCINDLFYFPYLSGSKLRIDYKCSGSGIFHQTLNFFEFSIPHECRSRRTITFLCDCRNNIRPCSFTEHLHFIDIFTKDFLLQISVRDRQGRLFQVCSTCTICKLAVIFPFNIKNDIFFTL